MKKMLLMLIQIIFVSILFAGGTKEFSYAEYDKYTGDNNIFLKNIEDFYKIAKEKRIKRIFGFNGNLYDTGFSEFMIVAPEVLYRIDGKGYENINDYRLGIKKQFEFGSDYYLSEQLKFNTYSDFKYSIDNWIENSYIHEEFMNGAYDKIKIDNSTRLLYPQRIGKEEFENSFLWIFVNMLSLMSIVISPEDPYYNEYMDLKLLDSSNARVENNLSNYKKNELLKLLTKSIIMDLKSKTGQVIEYNLTFIKTIGGHGPSTVELPFKVEKDYYVYKSEDKLFFPQQRFNADKVTIPNGVFYYLTKINGYDNFVEYLEYCKDDN